jgi:4-amino-4-deoxy-L-arabinose transferase-like glycosyltransferase
MTERTSDPAGRASSVAAADAIVRVSTLAHWRSAFWIAFIALGLVKLWLAATLSPFVDEAFYWQESRHPAWSYSDVPGMTAWLIRCGEFVFGHSTLAMRAPFLLLGALLPLLMVRMVTRIADARAGWQAGLWTMALPLAGTLGVLALPDVPLTFASLLALDAFERASRHARWRDWNLLGLALALAWLSHYRAAMLLLAGFAFLTLTARGRSLWRQPGLWICLAIAASGLVPLLVFNLQHDWSALGFQLVERHPWAFHADALIQPIEQAIVVTPFLYGLLLAVLVIAWRRRRLGAPWDLFACSALIPLIAYFVFGLFADDERFRVHWPLPGYLPLIALLPLLGRELRARWIDTLSGAAALIAALGGAAVLAYLAVASIPEASTRLSHLKAFPANFVGWHESGRVVESLLEKMGPEPIILVADNFMLAAQLDFVLDGTRPIHTLDSPLNTKHGRAAQLRLWAQDETALRAYAGQRVLLVVEETSLRERERAAWLDSLCTRIDVMRPLQRLDLHAGRKRFAFYAGVVPAMPDAAKKCSYPPQLVLTE